ncbi:MAG: Holliday junction resolvase RuvX [Candidatus Fimivicinus sp.]|nr:Holliday junction resolvase RuvX [Oscillospiraceae bacterium]MDY5591099.1 Holliday junction resolvase RuvX [Candidatus Fimivicinus sp.]
MVILSVDYGDVRTGIAVCDKLEMLASPVAVLTETYAPKLVDLIVAETQKCGAQEMILGLPRNMDGSEGFRAQKCREFATLLEAACGIPVRLWDERLTTVRAHQVLNQTNTRGKKRKAVVDAVSAVMILQDYIDYRKTHAMPD